ncbi:hypothetical protein COMA2_280003 [Candidatus Nitrospira nitrificans]|uniref:Uncharacterized protein n=1 Tax=Candidatus Nitrospira nitrificans TaxID=1742973 RepID=A0A0S4LGY6_9BACT|nr:hypothetical protein COMA2_280003 [Candidatus Nitrospira nitrificans]
MRHHVHPRCRVDLLINRQLVDHTHARFRRERMGLLKNRGLTAFSGQGTAKDQAAVLEAGVKAGGSHNRRPWRRGEMPRDAHHAEEHERNRTSGKNPRTSHGINSPWTME